MNQEILKKVITILMERDNISLAESTSIARDVFQRAMSSNNLSGILSEELDIVLED